MTTTNHPLTETRAQALWDKREDDSGFRWNDLFHDQPTALAAMRAAYDAGREHEREHADPFHDARPWQDCTRKDIREDDLVEAQCGTTTTRISVAHQQDDDGDWWAEDGFPLTWGDHWPLRRIPAPTPPAEEVELPTEHPAHITDVETAYGTRCAHMALDCNGEWVGVDQTGYFRPFRHAVLVAFTLPDGTRARRDGDHEDGTPRFVKEDDQ